MNNSAMMNISAVERDTGLGKDTLRVWERRYDFPQPVRDANGERLYPAEQVERLRQIKRLMDQGHRPGRLFAASAEELLAHAGTRRAGEPAGIEKPAIGALSSLCRWLVSNVELDHRGGPMVGFQV